MSKQSSGLCRLCLSETLLVNSHIVPKFHYKPIKEEDGSYIVVSSNLDEKESKGQKGETERLFCNDCDNRRLQKNEDHLAEVMFHKQLPGIDSPDLVEIQGYDYKKLKLALLSILWRMSITTRPIYRYVDLGPKHNERLRQNLLKDEDLREDEYPILLSIPFWDGVFFPNILTTPYMFRANGNRVYECLISGLLFTFIVGAVPIEASFKVTMIRRDRWKMAKVPAEKNRLLWESMKKITHNFTTARSG